MIVIKHYSSAKQCSSSETVRCNRVVAELHTEAETKVHVCRVINNSFECSSTNQNQAPVLCVLCSYIKWCFK